MIVSDYARRLVIACAIGNATDDRVLIEYLSKLEAVAWAARAEQCEHCAQGRPRRFNSTTGAAYHGYEYTRCTSPKTGAALDVLGDIDNANGGGQ